MNITPTVSAIVSTYNSERFIRGKIEDLLSQSIYNELEIIIINSGSQQNEKKIIEEYLKNHSNINYIETEERETVYKAWNRGIDVAKGKFITNANTDDRLKKNAYEILSCYLMNHPDVALIYADQYLSFIENETYYQARNRSVIQFPDYSHVFQLERCIIGSQPMWRSSVHWDDNIWFNENYEVSSDHEFELRVSERYRIAHFPETLGVFYKSPSKTNKETENIERTKKEVKEVTNKYLEKYINQSDTEILLKDISEIEKYIWLPLFLYILFVKIERRIFRRIYPKYFKHSIEFVYYFLILAYGRIGKEHKATKLCNRFLRLKNSNRIKSKCLELKRKKVANE